MITLADLFPPDENGQWTESQMLAMSQRVASAYGAVFSGRGTADDADLVKVDLALFTRYLDTTSLSTSSDVLRAISGRQSVMARIAEGIIRSGGDLNGLHKAVLMSPPVDVEET